MSDNAVHYDAVVIGGGVAGLYAAYKLVRDGKTRVCVLEAKDSLGGRVRQIHGVAPWPLEAGPEFVHGAKSILVDVLQNDVGMKLHEKGWPDHIYWGGEQRLLPAEDPAHKTMDEVDRLMFEELPKQDIPAQDSSVHEWMRGRGASALTLELADVCYANDFGTSLSKLGLTEAILESRQWDAGEEYLFKDRSFQHLIDHLARGVSALTRWPVARVDWVPNQGARLVSAHGQLKKAAIQFTPPLSPAKTAAVQRIHMGNAIKVFAVFSQLFWPADMWDVVCTDRIFPEVWMTRNNVESTEAVDAAAELHCVTAFVCGERAERIAAMAPRDAVLKLVQQLDEVFGGSGGAAPATGSFVRGYVKDWSKEPYIEGAYTSPTLGAREGDRALLAGAEGGVLFFAGEHTNSGLNPCVQGAMETGARAALEVGRVLEASRTGSRL